MVTRNVVLTDTQDQLVQALVASGRFQNASEAMRAGLRLLEEQEAEVLKLRTQLQTALAQADDGDLAQGTGADAIRRAFDAARTGA
ncbi:MAG: type II toxin-antitoxin system ParD family antitoxin [Pseudomonadota bacterium]